MICAELYPLLRSRNVLTVRKHSDSTWKQMSQCSRLDKKEEGSWISQRRYAAEPPTLGLVFHSRLFKERPLSAFLSGMMYCSRFIPGEQSGLGGFLVGFINKLGFVKHTDGLWPKRSQYLHLTS